MVVESVSQMIFMQYAGKFIPSFREMCSFYVTLSDMVAFFHIQRKTISGLSIRQMFYNYVRTSAKRSQDEERYEPK